MSWLTVSPHTLHKISYLPKKISTFSKIQQLWTFLWVDFDVLSTYFCSNRLQSYYDSPPKRCIFSVGFNNGWEISEREKSTNEKLSDITAYFDFFTENNTLLSKILSSNHYYGSFKGDLTDRKSAKWELLRYFCKISNIEGSFFGVWSGPCDHFVCFLLNYTSHEWLFTTTDPFKFMALKWRYWLFSIGGFDGSVRSGDNWNFCCFFVSFAHFSPSLSLCDNFYNLISSTF